MPISRYVPTVFLVRLPTMQYSITVGSVKSLCFSKSWSTKRFLPPQHTNGLLVRFVGTHRPTVYAVPRHGAKTVVADDSVRAPPISDSDVAVDVGLMTLLSMTLAVVLLFLSLRRTWRNARRMNAAAAAVAAVQRWYIDIGEKGGNSRTLAKA